MTRSDPYSSSSDSVRVTADRIPGVFLIGLFGSPGSCKVSGGSFSRGTERRLAAIVNRTELRDKRIDRSHVIGMGVGEKNPPDRLVGGLCRS